jgi:hypothetical protein
MAFNALAVLYGRDFAVFTVPHSSTNTLPADTLLYGTAWGTPSGQSAPWVDVGYTDGGLSFTIGVTRGSIRVDQSLDDIAKPATGRDMSLSTQMAEFTTTNIYTAAGQGTPSSLAATTAVRGYNDLDIGPTIVDAYRSIGFDILHPGDAQAFRVVGWRTLPSGSVNGQINAEDNATIGLDCTCFPDTTTTPNRILKIHDVVAISA